MWTGGHHLLVVVLFLCLASFSTAELRTCTGGLCPRIPPNVPDHCIQEEKFTRRGNTVCMVCAFEKPFCDYSRNVSAKEYIPLCPNPCPSLPAVRDSCIRRGPIQWLRMGSQIIRCRQCPTANPFCLDSDLPLCPEDSVNCIGVIENTPIECIDQKIKGIQVPCLTCQKLKARLPECQLYNFTHLPMCRKCPKLPNIPARCINLGRVLTIPNGHRCRECPSPNINCNGLKLKLCDPENCAPLPAFTTRSCILQTIIDQGNTPCLTCPRLRKECERRINPIPPCPDNENCIQIPRSFPDRCIREGLIKSMPNGMVCRGCPYVNPSCEEYPLRVCTQIEQGCASLPSDTELKCIEQDVLDFGLGLCLSCPRLKTDPACIPLCPGEVCSSLTGIPESCIKPGLIHQGVTGECRHCPTVDPSCVTDSSIKLCPNIVCNPLTGIPSDCVKKAPQKRLPDGSICSECPEIDPFCPHVSLPLCSNHILDCVGVANGTDITCIEQKVLFVNEHCLTCPSLKQEPRCLPPVDIGGLRPCPVNRCKNYPTSLIPVSCYTLGARLLLSNGLECRGCPNIDPFCKDLKLQLCASEVGSCKVLPASLSLDCKTADVFEEDGLPCLSCPKIKQIPACLQTTTVPRIDTPPPPPPPDTSVTKTPAVLEACEGVSCIPTVGIDETCLSNAQVIARPDGTRCLGCRKISISCDKPSFNICPSQEGTCTPISSDVDKVCISQQVMYENNAHCLTCKFVIPDCYVSLSRSICSNLVCEPLPPETPQECITQEALIYNGVECYSCPAKKPGCGENPLANNPFLQS